jgi:hypothetical protein
MGFVNAEFELCLFPFNGFEGGKKSQIEISGVPGRRKFLFTT